MQNCLLTRREEQEERYYSSLLCASKIWIDLDLGYPVHRKRSVFADVLDSMSVNNTDTRVARRRRLDADKRRCPLKSSIDAFFQPTLQATECDVLYDFRVLWQSPRSSKLL
jgi:hypothetical protein